MQVLQQKSPNEYAKHFADFMDRQEKCMAAFASASKGLLHLAIAAMAETEKRGMTCWYGSFLW